MMKVSVSFNKDGTMRGSVRVPDAGEMTIELIVVSLSEPNVFKINKGKESKTVPITTCRHNPQFEKPLDGDEVASGIPLKLQTNLSAPLLQKANLEYTIEVGDPSLLEDPSLGKRKISATKGEASWMPPKLVDGPEQVFAKVYLAGKIDGMEVCPPSPVLIELSRKSILVSTEVQAKPPNIELPEGFASRKNCIVSVDCGIDIEVVESETTSQPLLKNPNTILKIIDPNGNVIHTQNNTKFLFLKKSLLSKIS